jgi:hypothetical protein
MTDCQLYLISPLDVSGDFPQRLERAIEAGPGLVTAFQFRVKGLDQHEAARLAAPLQAICAAHDVAFIVNDDVALAKRLGADGVHLGQGDGEPRDAREELGREAQIGVKRARTMSPSAPSSTARPRRANIVPNSKSSNGGAICSRFPASRSAESRPPIASRWSRPGPISSPCPGRSGMVTKWLR